MLWQKINPVGYYLNVAQEKAEYERKEKCRKLLDFYHDEQLPYIYERLKKHFSDPDKFSLASLNIVRKIIDATATVYFLDARRTVSKDQDTFDNIKEGANLGLKMKQANRLSKLTGTVLVKVVYRNNRIELDLITGDIADVETGESPEDIQSVTVCYYPESGKWDEVFYSKWTAESVSRLDYNLNVVSYMENPYGTLPFCPVWDSLPLADFWNTKGDSLVSVQEGINEKITDLLYILRLQGFSVPVTKGSSAEIGILDPGHALNIPADADFTFEAPNSPIKSTLDTIDFLIRQTAVSYGLPASYLSSKPSERKSGIARLIENAELQEKRADDIALFKKYETEVFEKIKVVNNQHSDKKISPDATLDVQFAEPRSVNIQEQAQAWETLMEKNVLSPIDCIQKLNPELTRKEAEQIYQYNKKLNSPDQGVKQEN